MEAKVTSEEFDRERETEKRGLVVRVVMNAGWKKTLGTVAELWDFKKKYLFWD